MPTDLRRQNIKQRINERVLALMTELGKTAGIREIARKRTLFELAAIKPALHLVTGPEIVLEEDNRGYRLEYPVFFKLFVSEARNLEDEVDRYVGLIQETVETDSQLAADNNANALALKVTYDGEQPFGEEILKPGGGTVVAYRIEYRRYIAEPKYNY